MKVEWLDHVPGGPGYTIRKLRYEALPGLWIPALLYVPEKIVGKAPVFLNVNGHDPIGKAVDYKQMRCINQAKRGIIALNPEWFGMGQFRTEGFAHGRMNQLDLCGTSGLAPFYLAMKRGLDVLLSLEQADPTRVGVAGLSGGGWQTIIVSSLDSRVTLSNPVAGYSSFITRGKNFSDLGDSEQTPVDLATVADYSHLTALMAPRATLLTYNLNDNCCFKADHALPPLLDAGRPFFRLYGRDDNLRYHINAEPGDHNFQKENREALYQMIGVHFFPDDRDYNPREIPSEGELRTPDQFAIPVPADNADFHTLALALAKDLPRDGELPQGRDAAREWQRTRRSRLAKLIQATDAKISIEVAGEADAGTTHAMFWKLRMNNEWTTPVVELTRGPAKGTTLIVGDRGRKDLVDQIDALLRQGERVIAVDPFFIGESSLGNRDYLFALLVSTVGQRPLGVQVTQLGGVADWLVKERQIGTVRLCAHGPRESLAALAAAGLHPDSILRLELHQSLASLKEVIEQNRKVDDAPELFCFGLLERFDILQMAALVAPREIDFGESRPRMKQELAPLDAWRQLLK
ncbi:MAG: hypothetical protein NT069_13305 [Planctomycetota bacterium]|nr:hypothetical protein [Planctomycetota bacterium]